VDQEDYRDRVLNAFLGEIAMTSASLVAGFAIVGTSLCACSIAILLLSDSYSAKLKSRLRELPAGNGLRSPANGLAALRSLPAGRDEGTLPKARGGSTDGDEDRKRRQSQLIQAGIYNPSALVVFLATRAGLTIAPPLAALIAAAVGALSPWIAMLCGASLGIAGMMLPLVWLQNRIRRRHCMLRQALADFLDLMNVCLHSGLSLQSTIQSVSDELRIAHPEFAGELNIVQRDISLGATVDGALRRFAQRTGCDGIGTLAKFVREAQRLGTQLTEALRIHADMLRSHREAAAEEAAQKAAVKILMPTLLLILPAVFIVLAGPAVIQIQQVFAK
jgi:tight adherence protein C